MFRRRQRRRQRASAGLKKFGILSLVILVTSSGGEGGTDSWIGYYIVEVNRKHMLRQRSTSLRICCMLFVIPSPNIEAPNTEAPNIDAPTPLSEIFPVESFYHNPNIWGLSNIPSSRIGGLAPFLRAACASLHTHSLAHNDFRAGSSH